MMKMLISIKHDAGNHLKVISIAALLIMTLTLIPINKTANAVIVNNLVVDTTADDPSKTACTASPNDCSLRGAISHINSDATLPSPEYHIQLGAYTYTLTTHGSGEDLNATGDLDFDYPGIVTIEGLGWSQTVINGDSADRVIELRNGTLNLTLLAIRSGVTSGLFETGGGISSVLGATLNLLGVQVDQNTSAHEGGGVSISNGTLNITFSLISGNHAPDGGGVSTYNSDTVILGTWFSGNIATSDAGGGLLTAGGTTQVLNSYLVYNEAGRGGGIFNGGNSNISIVDSVLLGNSATNGGGGLLGYGLVTIERSEISENSAEDGGGAYMDASSFTFTNVTIASNTALYTSGIYATNDNGTLSGAFDHVTITGNTSSGSGTAVNIYLGSVRLMNSIVNATDGNNACYIGSVGAFLTSFDYNIASDGTCNLLGGNDHPSTDPQLMPLGNHGGPGRTALPINGSLAIDHANPTFSPTDTDQRGIPRVDGDKNGTVIPDIGAAEFLPYSAFLPLIDRP